MTQFLPVSAKTYYDYVPGPEHRCGDVWQGLPSLGLLGGHKTVKGLMVTPDCDVSNFKTETLTYLPILPIEAYFSTLGYLPVLRREIFERLKCSQRKASVRMAGTRLPSASYR